MSKSKKITIAVITAIVTILAITVTTYIIIQKKSDPKGTLKEYIFKVNSQDYDAMYELLDAESKNNISKDDFVARNKSIYSGIDMQNMQIEIKSEEKQSNSKEKIVYEVRMDSSAGKITFENTVILTKAGKEGYLINWNSNLIFPKLNNEDKVKVKTIGAKRGDIQDRNGISIASTGKVSNVGIVPGKLGENKGENIEKIANLLNIKKETIEKNLQATWVKDDSFVPIKSISKDNNELKQKLLQISGVKITSSEARVYPSGEALSHITGYVQNITAEELEENAGKGYTQNSIIGKTGLEKKYEEVLRGTDGVEIYIEDENGNKKSTIAKKDVVNGENVKLTIDSCLQNKLYNELKDNEGFLAMMNPTTGEILALVSTPSYNANDFVLGISRR